MAGSGGARVGGAPGTGDAGGTGGVVAGAGMSGTAGSSSGGMVGGGVDDNGGAGQGAGGMDANGGASGAAGEGDGHGAGGGGNAGNAPGGVSGGGRGGATTGSGGAGGLSAAGGTAGAGDPDLVLWYRFDETSGQTATDSSGYAGGPRNATLGTAGVGGGIVFRAATYEVGTGAVALTANGPMGGGYVTVPSLYDLVPDAVTIASWVYPTSSMANQRIFDLGSGITTFMFLNTADTSGYVRFAITNSGIATEQRIQTSTTLSLNSWHHIALVIAGGNSKSGTIYVDGASVATATLTLGVHELGVTTNNYLGRSQFVYDAYLAGALDDFRVYKRALTKPEISAIYALR